MPLVNSNALHRDEWGDSVSETTADSLKNISLLEGLKAAELSAIEKLCHWKRFAAQEQIIDRQSNTNDVCFVTEGSVRVVNFSLSGREVTLDDLHAGGYFGELAALDGEPRSASVQALSECQIAFLTPESFNNVLKTHPEIAIKVMRNMASIIRTSTERIMDLSTLGANNRVHAELLRQAIPNISGDNTAAISPIPVHADIASRVSTTRETVARVLNELARQGIVDREKDALVIVDVKSLQSMVEEVRGE